ncbi:MAG TPA: hypothetical protein VLQ68_01045 [Rhizobiaceae bacterium]|nr:hypothetical protein [Rhizobiaceae bacterium]
MTSVTDEMLMAYADGELTAAGRRSVEKALEHDPALARQLAIYAEVGRLSRDAVKEDPAWQPSARLSELVAGRIAASQRAEKAGKTRGGARIAWPSLAAASLFLAGLAAGYYGDRFLGEPRSGEIALLQSPDITGALSQVPMGRERRLEKAGEFRAVLSFRNAEGSLCREFELHAASGNAIVAVACNDGGSWQTRFAAQMSAGGGQYTPASSMEALSAWLGATGAGAPLSETEEAAALAAIKD